MSAPALRVTLVQADTIWHDAAANRARLEEQLAARAGRTDVVILPETFTTGFSNEAIASAEGMQGPTLAWMHQQARALDAAVTGSLQIRDGAAVYNRLLWVTPDGAVQHYDKRHLFRMAREQERYTAGDGRIVVDFRGWRICPLVCYDLRFPVFSRNVVRGTPDDAPGGTLEGALDFDLLIYVANWPAPRHEHWRALLRARAIENLCVVAAVNRAGTDGNGHPYAGGSTIIDALGATVVECDASAQVTDATVSLQSVLDYRARFPAHLDADRFTLE